MDRLPTLGSPVTSLEAFDRRTPNPDGGLNTKGPERLRGLLCGLVTERLRP